jgi:carbamate kinase
MRVVIALGGNAMTAPDGRAAPGDQIAALGRAAARIADVVAGGAEVVVTHGNGPQVGNLLVKNELAASVVPPVPLDWCGAQTQGTIGFVLMDELEPVLAGRRPVAALVTRTLVDAADPGLADPTKPIGRYLPAAEAKVMIEHGQVWRDRGERGWRRVVASPEPLEVLDAPAVGALLAAGYVVVAAGGGGIPVAREPDGTLHGVEAVIDKDLATAVLAEALEADALLLLTDVPAVVRGFGTPNAEPILRATPGALRREKFPAGSMGPKVEAVCRFVEVTGDLAAIGALADAGLILAGKAGTVVTPAGDYGGPQDLRPPA